MSTKAGENNLTKMCEGYTQQKAADFHFSFAIDINDAAAYNTIRRGRSPNKILFAP